ncbi:EthD family reductase [Bradyrhizobium amphicarpaeae]|uniref:EthD family reductase n=1 Tax=Bradyrhizobium amphicarpaeae TaxID=1404768 RepID=A0A2U8Q166_9BRAD|nr:EthD family reductase [Bradyrhizobium amphicarpaeae]AWM03682.1 EthD family reductase [Bradyrhizobium amphicarpaeae]
MAELVVLYKTPKDAAAFDKHYAETHIPLAKKLPGLKNYAVSTGAVGSPAGPSGIHLVAILTFDSVGDIQKAFGSEAGKAAAGDVSKFASGGADLLIFDTKDV